MQIITDNNFQKEVVEASTPVIVDFFADWCGPCRQLLPVMEQLSSEFEGKVKVVKINIDESPRTPAQFDVMRIPTLIAFKGGKAVSVQTGALPKSKLVEWFNSLM